jgi:hypothetical protein
MSNVRRRTPRPHHGGEELRQRQSGALSWAPGPEADGSFRALRQGVTARDSDPQSDAAQHREPHFHQLEPARRLVAADRGASAGGVGAGLAAATRRRASATWRLCSARAQTSCGLTSSFPPNRGSRHGILLAFRLPCPSRSSRDGPWRFVFTRFRHGTACRHRVEYCWWLRMSAPATPSC